MYKSADRIGIHGLTKGNDSATQAMNKDNTSLPTVLLAQHRETERERERDGQRLTDRERKRETDRQREKESKRKAERVRERKMK